MPAVRMSQAKCPLWIGLAPDVGPPGRWKMLLHRATGWPVEAVFGTLKRCYAFHRMRYFSARRNAVAVALACIGFNLRRWRVCAMG